MNNRVRLVRSNALNQGELSAMIYISGYPLFCFPSTGYVKFEFLIQHNSSTELSDKTKNLFTR